MRQLSLAFGAMLMSTMVDAQAVSLKVIQFSESSIQVVRHAENGPSAGATIQVSNPGPARGVLTGALTELSAFPVLYVAGLRPGDQRLCLTIVSADGEYNASGEAVITAQAASSGVAMLDLPSKNQDLMAQPADELGAVVRVVSSRQACFSQKGDAPILAAQWGTVPAPKQPIHVLISDGGERRPLELRPETSAVGASCAPIKNLVGGVSFRQECSIRIVPNSTCSAVRLMLETSGQSVERKGILVIRPDCRGG